MAVSPTSDYTLLDEQQLAKRSWRSYGERHSAGLCSISRVSSNVIHFAVLYIVIALLSGLLLLSHGAPSQQLYSPAAEAIDNKNEVWPDNLSYKTPYMADGVDGMPTDETDRLWNELYEFGIVHIPSSQAALLPNETAALASRPDQYPIEIAVFHQLHCLNHLRMAFYPDRYPHHFPDLLRTDGNDHRLNYSSHDAHHIAHCIDSLRMTIMCHSDVTALSWTYDQMNRKPMPTLEVQHTCRDFEAIRQWAAERAIVDEADLVWPAGEKANFMFRGKANN